MGITLQKDSTTCLTCTNMAICLRFTKMTICLIWFTKMTTCLRFTTSTLLACLPLTPPTHFTMSTNLRFLVLYIGLLLSMVLAKETLKLTLTLRLNLIITTVILGLPLIFHLGIVFPLLIDLLGTKYPLPTPKPQKMPAHTWIMPCLSEKLCNH